MDATQPDPAALAADLLSLKDTLYDDEDQVDRLFLCDQIRLASETIASQSREIERLREALDGAVAWIDAVRASGERAENCGRSQADGEAEVRLAAKADKHFGLKARAALAARQKDS